MMYDCTHSKKSSMSVRQTQSERCFLLALLAFSAAFVDNGEQSLTRPAKTHVKRSFSLLDTCQLSLQSYGEDHRVTGTTATRALYKSASAATASLPPTRRIRHTRHPKRGMPALRQRSCPSAAEPITGHVEKSSTRPAAVPSL